MLTQLVVTVRIPVSASTLLICWPRETAQVSVFGCLVRQKPAGREWDGFSLNFHCPGKMAEAAVPPVSLDLVGGKAAWLSHAGLSPTGAS